MSSSSQICFLFFRQLRKDLEDQFEVYIFAPLYIILFTSLKPALLQTLRHQSALPHTRTETQVTLKSTTMQSWQGVIAKGWHCERIRKVIMWARNLFSTIFESWGWLHFCSNDGWAFLSKHFKSLVMDKGTTHVSYSGKAKKTSFSFNVLLYDQQHSTWCLWVIPGSG